MGGNGTAWIYGTQHGAMVWGPGEGWESVVPSETLYAMNLPRQVQVNVQEMPIW